MPGNAFIAGHFGIAGAGIMGRLLAWKLVELGHQVSVFDRDPMDSGSAAAYTAAGMLAPYSELESAEHVVYELGQRSLELWPQIAADIGAADCLHQRGSLAVAHTQDLPDLIHFQQTLKRKLGAECAAQSLDRETLRAREPELADQFDRALDLPGEAWVYTDRMLRALADAVIARGATWHSEADVLALHPGVIETAQGQHRFDAVIDCRGLGAKADLPRLRGVRGEVIHVRAPDVSLRHMVRLMHPRYRLYLVPREDHHYLLGATQIESEDSSEISVRSALELLSALYAIHPGFGEARILETRTNCRPALLDNLPAIAQEPGLMRVNGLFRHGYLLAPALAEQAAQQLLAAAEPLTLTAQPGSAL